MQTPDAAPAPAPSETDVEALIEKMVNAAIKYGCVCERATSTVVDRKAANLDAINARNALAAALRHERDQRTALEEARHGLLARCDDLIAAWDDPVAEAYDGATTRAAFRQAVDAARRSGA